MFNLLKDEKHTLSLIGDSFREFIITIESSTLHNQTTYPFIEKEIHEVHECKQHLSEL